MKVLDLFSGIGGFSLGLERAGFETAAFCEVETYCQHVLAKNFPGTPIFGDIKELEIERSGRNSIARYKGNVLNLGEVAGICGGFPCQPYSTAGKQRAKNDDRDLWPEMFRLIKAVGPTWVIGENVANFTNLEFTRTKFNLESIGYEVLPFNIPACAVQAPDERKRVWIIAHLNKPELWHESRGSSGENWEREAKLRGFGQEEFTPHSNGNGSQSSISLPTWHQDSRPVTEWFGEFWLTPDPDKNGFSDEADATQTKNNEGIGEGDGWAEATTNLGDGGSSECGMVRVIHGLSPRLDSASERLRKSRVAALGNALKPQIVEILGRAIMEIERTKN